jgi:hypothetical protein
MNTYAHLASFLPRAMALRMAAIVDAVPAAAWNSMKKMVAGATVSWRNVDAVDGLDGRMLRDIGAAGWNAAREAQNDREAMRSRLDAEFRG